VSWAGTAGSLPDERIGSQPVLIRGFGAVDLPVLAGPLFVPVPRGRLEIWQMGQRISYRFFGVVVVFQFSRQIAVVRRHVEMSVAR